MMSLRSSSYSKNEVLALVFVFHSTFDVGRWMFDVHLFQQTFLSLSRSKNNLPLMRGEAKYTKKGGG
jgi:hypothetical protein